MIITRTWLSEFIDLSNKTLQDLTQTLNSIGIEVDRVEILKAPEKIVVGFVKEKIKHENAEKLSICQVDVGSETLQIVCGAPNVEAGQFVPVALVGAVMPNGMEIKKAKLRGVESCGMICSSSELGFAKINEGIMVLDESIGELVLGKALNEYEIFNDELVEVELTPNRGDCLSVYGIARDLSVAWDLELRSKRTFKESENPLGIGRVLRLVSQNDLNSLFHYRAIKLEQNFNTTLLFTLRLAQIELLTTNSIENLLRYATHSIGVLFNAYDFNKLSKDESEVSFHFNKDANEATQIECDGDLLAVSGVYQSSRVKCDENSKIIIIEANYTNPATIAKVRNHYKEQDDKIFYRSFRGSEPYLDLGMNFLLALLDGISNLMIYGSSQQISNQKEKTMVGISMEFISQTIGQEISKDDVARILKKLGFELSSANEDIINVKIPLHRSDIQNSADICEEVLRMIGIDNIQAKSLEFVEKNRFNESFKSYKELLNLRLKAVNQGYFESLHYVLDNTAELKDFTFKNTNLKLVNPITAELDTLRTTLLNHLLNAASLNVKNSKKIVKLFESGAVFDAQSNELNHMALVYCGYKEEAKISNKAKPKLVEFYDFLLDMKNIIGAFKLKESNYSFLSPFEQADIYVGNVKIGFLGRLHVKIENQRDLLKTYVCEFDLNLLKEKPKIAKAYSKFPSMSRDLSVLIPKGFSYEQIQDTIKSLNLSILESFRIVDIYSDESLKDDYSLTISFTFRDFEKTLEDTQVLECMEIILKNLENLGLKLR